MAGIRDVQEPAAPLELIAHVARTTDLTPTEAARVIADILSYYDEDLGGWIRRRHNELQRQGLTNPTIFERIANELPNRRFRAELLSARQLRRVIYG